MTRPRWWTLAALAKEWGVTADALRQRCIRGTLRATKYGNLWLVSPADARIAQDHAGRRWRFSQRVHDGGAP